jgi:hypothetical protein
MAGPFAMPLPVKDVVGSGKVTFDFASRDSMMPTGGHARLDLEGYVPPHPVELDGFVFGNVTTGKFVLKGGGNLTRQGDATRIRLDMNGALPCDALASAAAESRLARLLGRAAGRKAGIAALRVVGGSVTVRVQVDASTKNLPDAKLERSIGIGCGLKPLTLEDLRELGEQLFAGDLSKLPEDLGKLIPPGPLPIPSRLPPLPSGFPSSFRIPTSLPTPPPRPSASGR